jgi:dolichyl-phosphate-mannose-protein mannosyltransferase
MHTRKHTPGLFAAMLAAGLAILAGALMTPRILYASANLLVNGDLAKGSEHQPDDWRTEAWLNDPGAFVYDWTHPAEGGPGELKVAALKANDARWMQSLTLQPGWYHITAEVRTENIGTQATGATVSVMEDGIMSADIRGTSGWQPVGLYLKVGGHGADVTVALRVGGFGSLNTGTAYFRNARVEQIAAPAAGATPVYDLLAIRKAAQPLPQGQPITLVAVFVILGVIAAYGWWLFGIEEPMRKAAGPNRAERRRQGSRNE